MRIQDKMTSTSASASDDEQQKQPEQHTTSTSPEDEQTELDSHSHSHQHSLPNQTQTQGEKGTSATPTPNSDSNTSTSQPQLKSKCLNLDLDLEVAKDFLNISTSTSAQSQGQGEEVALVLGGDGVDVDVDDPSVSVSPSTSPSVSTSNSASNSNSNSTDSHTATPPSLPSSSSVEVLVLDSNSKNNVGGSDSKSSSLREPSQLQLQLREWSGMNHLLSKIPQKAQKGLTTLELRFTCVASAGEYLALGTNLGLVYWYSRAADRLDRFKTEAANSPITALSLLSSVDYMLAVGNSFGHVTIFQIPKLFTFPAQRQGHADVDFQNRDFRDRDRTLLQNQNQSNRYEVTGLHSGGITALEWSANGMKLFSGDSAGSVLLTELNYDQGQATSRPLLALEFEIVQLSYAKKNLLVCSTSSAIIYSLETATTFKVGTQERKIQGRFGGIFQSPQVQDNKQLKLYSVRPGGRVWVSNSLGVVEHTIKFKDVLLEEHSRNLKNIPLINPTLQRTKESKLSQFQDFQIGTLHRYRHLPQPHSTSTSISSSSPSEYLVTAHKNILYLLDPLNTQDQIPLICVELQGLLALSVNSDPTSGHGEIFVLESPRNLIRLAAQPDSFLQIQNRQNSSQSSDFPFLKGLSLSQLSQLSDPFALSLGGMMSGSESSPFGFSYLSSKFRETSRALPLHKLNSTFLQTIKQVIEADVNIQDGQFTNSSSANQNQNNHPSASGLPGFGFPLTGSESIPLKPPPPPPQSQNQTQVPNELSNEALPEEMVAVTVTLPVDKFEHISNLPFDDEFLVVPKAKAMKPVKVKSGGGGNSEGVAVALSLNVNAKKKLRERKSKSKLNSPSGDTMSLSSCSASAYSANTNSDVDVEEEPSKTGDEAETETAKLSRTSKTKFKSAKPPSTTSFPKSMSLSWTAGQNVPILQEVSLPDLETKEEILARRLNWPELIPDSRRANFENFKECLTSNTSNLPVPDSGNSSTSTKNSDIDNNVPDYEYDIKNNIKSIKIKIKCERDELGPDGENGSSLQTLRDRDRGAGDDDDISCNTSISTLNSTFPTHTSTSTSNSNDASTSTSTQVNHDKSLLMDFNSNSNDLDRAAVLPDFEESIDIYTKYAIREDSQDSSLYSASAFSCGPPSGPGSGPESGKSSLQRQLMLQLHPQPNIIEIDGNTLQTPTSTSTSEDEDFQDVLGFGHVQQSQGHRQLRDMIVSPILPVSSSSELELDSMWISYSTPSSTIHQICCSNFLIFCVDRRNRVYYSRLPFSSSSTSTSTSPSASPSPGIKNKNTCLSLRWIEAGFRASQLSISSSTLWRLHKGALYSMNMNINTDTEDSSLFARGRGEWFKLTPGSGSGSGSGEVVTMCMEPELGVGWIVKSDGVYLCTITTTSSSLNSVPYLEKVDCPWPISQLVIGVGGDGNCIFLWGVTTDGRLIYREGITQNNLRGVAWKERKLEKGNVSVVGVALGPRNTVWITTTTTKRSSGAGERENELYIISGVSEYDPGGHSYEWKVQLQCGFGFRCGFGFGEGEGEFLPCVSGSGGGSPTGAGVGNKLASWKTKLSDSFAQYSRDSREKLKASVSKAGNLLLPSRSKEGQLLVCASSSAVWYFPVGSSSGSSTIHLNKRKVEGNRWGGVNFPRCRVSQWRGVFAGSVYLDNGLLWLIDHKGKLFSTTSTSSGSAGELKAVDPPCSNRLSCIIPAPEALWVLTQEGKIFARCNISPTNPTGHRWLPIDLSPQDNSHFVQVSCGSDVAWGCDSKGKVFMRVGSLRPVGPNDISPAWLPVEGEGTPQQTNSFKTSIFTKVFVGSSGSMVWGIDSLNNIYVREAIYPDFPIGTRWLLVSGIEAVDLALSEKAVWALSPSGEIFRRVGISATNFVGDYWKKTPGHLKTLSVSVCDELWGLDMNGQLQKHFHSSIDFQELSKRRSPKPKVILDPEDKDWELVESL